MAGIGSDMSQHDHDYDGPGARHVFGGSAGMGGCNGEGVGSQIAFVFFFGMDLGGHLGGAGCH